MNCRLKLSSDWSYLDLGDQETCSRALNYSTPCIAPQALFLSQEHFPKNGNFTLVLNFHLVQWPNQRVQSDNQKNYQSCQKYKSLWCTMHHGACLGVLHISLLHLFSLVWMNSPGACVILLGIQHIFLVSFADLVSGDNSTRVCDSLLGIKHFFISSTCLGFFKFADFWIRTRALVPPVGISHISLLRLFNWLGIFSRLMWTHGTHVRKSQK